MQKFKNIIFDLGGVILAIDFSKTEKAFANLGVTNFGELFSQHHASPLFKELEVGQITPDEFYDAFRKAVNLNLTNEQIEDAWNALIESFEMKRLNWLEEISKRYNTYLFSNTNLIHHIAFQRNFREITGKPNFNDYFKKAFYSHEIGVRKPMVEAFNKVVELANLNPEETLFIDDTKGNTEAAQQAGLSTILLEKPLTILDLDL